MKLRMLTLCPLKEVDLVEGLEELLRICLVQIQSCHLRGVTIDSIVEE